MCELMVDTSVIIDLSEEILSDFELSRIPLSKILFKCERLYRLLNDDFNSRLFMYEITQYPTKDDKPEVYKYYIKAGRYQTEYSDSKKKDVAFIVEDSVEKMETIIQMRSAQLSLSSDPNVQLSSANQYQTVSAISNRREREAIVNTITVLKSRLGKIRGALYKVVLDTYYKIKFEKISTTANDSHVELLINKLVNRSPKCIEMIQSIQQGLSSENPEDWANSVHSCRRLIKTVADSLYPPSDEKIKLNNKEFGVGEDQYINRLMIYIEKRKNNQTFGNVLKTNVDLIGNRIDALHGAANKGTHSNVSLYEATQYAIYTFLILGDILSLEDTDEDSRTNSL